MSGGHTVLAGDQPTFKLLFKSFHDGYEMNMNDTHKWMIPITGGFHSDKTGLIDVIKSTIDGTGIECFLEDD